MYRYVKFSKVSQLIVNRRKLNPSQSDSKAFALYLRELPGFVGPDVYIIWGSWSFKFWVQNYS